MFTFMYPDDTGATAGGDGGVTAVKQLSSHPNLLTR